MATSMAATIRKFQLLRIQMQRPLTTWSASNYFGSPRLLQTATCVTSMIRNAPQTKISPQVVSRKTTMTCHFSSSRPPAPPSGRFHEEPVTRLQRPPSLSLERIPPKLRNHAVSLSLGDYHDPHETHVRFPEFQHEGEENPGDDDDAYGPPEKEFNYDADEDDEDWSEDNDDLSYSSRWWIRSMQIEEQKQAARKARWMENAKPKVFVAKIDARGRAYGRGGRKTAHARVWIQPGFGNVVINRKDFVEYFTRDSDREHILMPLVVTGTAGKFDVQAFVYGSGLTGQAGAVRHGLARALQSYNPHYRPIMKRFGYMTRDPRQVERKKVGRLKARKKAQWNRR